MAYNEALTNRIRESVLELMKPGDKVEEKKMFRGVTFMVNGKMCISAGDEKIMCRIDPDLYNDVLEKNGCSPVIMKGRPYKGYVYVSTVALKNKKDMEYWVGLALEYNSVAKATPVKKKKKEG